MPEPLPEIDKLWDFGDPAASEQRFRDAIASADGPRKLEAMTQLARALGLQQKYDQAHATLNEIERDLADASPLIAVRYHLERGRVFNDIGRYDDCKASFLRAWDFAREAKLDGLAVDAAHMLAIVESKDGTRHLALDWHARAIEFARSSDQPAARRWLASLHNNYGWTLSELGRNEEALAVLEEALRLRCEMGQAGNTRIARFCVAKVKRLLGRIDEALAEQRQLMIEQHGQPADGVPVWVKTDGFGNEEIGECLLALGRADEARPHLAIAYDVLSTDPWLTAHEPERIARLKQLAGGGT
jgi:tetratricopeptide (TPR) repeat protein